MDNRRPKTRFHARTDLERAFISPVNAKFGEGAILAGMTRAAIESWRERAAAGFSADAFRIGQVAALLIEASTRAELLVDDSREVFEEHVRTNASSVDEIRQQLLSVL